MNGKDALRQERTHVRWSRIVPDLPPGIHEPKLDGDVGWDLEAMEDRTLGPMESCDVPVNARIWLPEGWYADVRNRSSMARRGLYVDQNVIDNGYRGDLFVFIRNMRTPFLHEGVDHMGSPTVRFASADDDPGTVTIKAGDRIAQLIFHHMHPVWMTEVDEVPQTTARAGAGFGSTGA